MAIVLIEALTFGLGRLVDAATTYNQELILLTRNKSVYQYELSKIDPTQLTIIEIDTLSLNQLITTINKINKLSGIINLTDTWSSLYIELMQHYQLPTKISNQLN